MLRRTRCRRRVSTPAGLRTAHRRLGQLGDVHRTVRQALGERPRLRQVMVLQVGARNSYAGEALSVIARAEIAEQRQERTHLPTVVPKVNAADVRPATGCPQSLHRLEIVPPVTPTTDRRCEWAA